MPLKKCSFRNYEETFYLGTNLKNVWKNVRDIAKPGQNEKLNMMVDNDVMDALMNSIDNDTLTATLDRDYAYTSSGDKDGSIRYTLKLEGTNTCEDHRVTEVGKAREVYTLTAVYTPRTRQNREKSMLGIYKERLNANVDIGDDEKTIKKTGSYTVNVVAGSLKISKVISKEDYEKSLESGDATFTFRVAYTPLKDQSKETIDDKSIDLYKTVRFTDKESYSLKETEDKKGYIISTTMNDLARCRGYDPGNDLVHGPGTVRRSAAGNRGETPDQGTEIHCRLRILHAVCHCAETGFPLAGGRIPGGQPRQRGLQPGGADVRHHGGERPSAPLPLHPVPSGFL